MRSLISVAFVSTLILPAIARTQEPPSPSASQRLFLSAGPGRTSRPGPLTGMLVRAEYSLTPLDRVLGMRVHLGAFWTPSQSFSVPSFIYGEGSTFEGFGQSAYLDLGVTGSVTPWPRARVSPYVVGGVAAVQQWTNGSGYYRRADGTPAASFPPSSGTRGLFTAVVGAGLRFRVGRHLWQLEARQLPVPHSSSLSLGTAVRF